MPISRSDAYSRATRMKTLKWTPVGVLVAGMVAAMATFIFLIAQAPVSAQPDTTPPTISSLAITSEPYVSDDYEYHRYYYGIDGVIEVTATFSENVTVTGAPKLELDIGGTPKTAGFLRAEGRTVVFGYTVAEGDEDNDGVAIGGNKITLNGGSIRDSANNDANLTHDALAAHTGHRVDGIRPRISYLGWILSGEYGEVITIGEELEAWLIFNEGVRFHNPESGTIKLKINLNKAPGNERYGYAKWDPTYSYAAFIYVVPEGVASSRWGASTPINPIVLDGGAILDRAGNDAIIEHPRYPFQQFIHH